MPVANIAGVLGGSRVLRDPIDSRMDLVKLSDKGVTKDALLHLADFLGLTVAQIAQLLPVTERTIQRYSRKQRFNHVVSEHILQIAEVATRGAEVFGEREAFVAWLSCPSQALAGQSPRSLLRSRFGTEMVLDELGRMEFGVLS